MANWNWVSLPGALAAHREHLTEHGGGDGIRDLGMFESAMHRPRNLASSGQPDAAQLAASYAFGLARNHPFVDGNMRTALFVCDGFLAKNGYVLTATNVQVVPIFLALAAGEISEDELAAWLRERIVKA